MSTAGINEGGKNVTLKLRMTNVLVVDPKRHVRVYRQQQQQQQKPL